MDFTVIVHIVNDPSMTSCPKCENEGAIVKLRGNLNIGKYCPYHGLIVAAQNPKQHKL